MSDAGDNTQDDVVADDEPKVKRSAARLRRRRQRRKRREESREQADDNDEDDSGEDVVEEIAEASTAAVSQLAQHRRLALSATITVVGIAIVAMRDSDIGAVVVVVGLLMLTWAIHRFGRLGVEST